MTWKTKLKITGPSGSSLRFDGELTTEQKDAVISALDLPGCTIGKSSAEPFGYFKAEPFGWTDCAETDEGARPLFELSTVQAVEKQRDDLLSILKYVAPKLEDIVDSRLVEEAIASVKGAATPTDPHGWNRITRPGQVKAGHKLRFTIGDVAYSATAMEILFPGTDREEIIYNKRRNYYLITSMCMANRGSQKNVEFFNQEKCAAS